MHRSFYTCNKVAGKLYNASISDGNGDAELSTILPYAVAFDRNDNIFLSDQDSMVKFINISDWKMSLFAGNSTVGFFGDGGDAKNATFSLILALSFDSDGDLLICDTMNNRVRKVAIASNVIDTVIGGGVLFADNISATSRNIDYPFGVAVNGDVTFILTAPNGLLLKVDSSRRIFTVAGTGLTRFASNVDAMSAKLDLSLTIGSQLAINSHGDLYLVNTLQYVLQKIDGASGRIFVIAGTGDPPNTTFPTDDVWANTSAISEAGGLCIDSSDNIYLIDTGYYVARRLDPLTHKIETIAGNYLLGSGFDEGDWNRSSLLSAYAVSCAVDSKGRVLFADRGSSVLRMIEKQSIILPTAVPSIPPNSPAEALPPQVIGLIAMGAILVASFLCGLLLCCAIRRWTLEKRRREDTKLQELAQVTALTTGNQ